MRARYVSDWVRACMAYVCMIRLQIGKHFLQPSNGVRACLCARACVPACVSACELACVRACVRVCVRAGWLSGGGMARCTSG